MYGLLWLKRETRRMCRLRKPPSHNDTSTIPIATSNSGALAASVTSLACTWSSAVRNLLVRSRATGAGITAAT